MSIALGPVVLGVTGSIAAYRAADLASLLTKAGVEVDVVMTRDALKFITPLTLQTVSHRPVYTPDEDLTRDGFPSHIALADRASLVLVAPATANLIAQASLGLAPDLLSSLLLATRAPLWMAPAMNGNMWLHPATQQHVEVLRTRGIEFLGPENGLLACGYEGMGRLWPVEKIAERVLNYFSGKSK